MTPGTKIGGFEILERLGAGGMGEVYRARDTRLRRDVAVKILPPVLAADPERLERLEREARMLAALNHPNIAGIYAVETAGTGHALVLELVEGETLAARLRRQPLTVPETRAIARQIIAALDAAHACGIVHRDLKPENVMIGPRGLVKVLDFGIAKMISPVTTDGVTATAGPTAEGAIVGTAAYMSPEQVRGQPVDRRTDIWAFGCVLYEMLGGRRAFGGATLSDTIVATLEKEPDWTALPADTPAGLRRLVERTLQKDPHLRLRDIADGLADLEDASAPRAAGPARFRYLPWAVAALGVAVSSWLWLRSSVPAPVTGIGETIITPLTRDAGMTTTPALSRDGRLLAYASDRAGGGTLDIWVQQISGGSTIRLTDDEADDTSPDFSPDGSQIIFQSDRQGGGVYAVSAFGGTQPRLVVRDGRRPRFSPDGSRIAYWHGAWRGTASTLQTGISIVSLSGGEPQRVAPEFRMARAPIWAPDGRSLLFLGRPDQNRPLAESFDWWFVKLDGSAPVKTGLFVDATLLAVEAEPSAWTPEGVLFSNGQDLWRVRISQEDGRIVQPPIRLTVSAGTYESVAVGPDGRIVFAATQRVRVIERAALEGSERLAPPVQLYADWAPDTGRPSETRDGATIVFERPVPKGFEIWTKDLRTRTEQLITRVESRSGLSSTISPDGARIAYNVAEGYGTVSASRGFVVETARGVPTKVCESCVVTGFLSDSRRLLTYSRGVIQLYDVVSGTWTDVISGGRGGVNRPHPSPDDRWLAFREGGKSFVAPLRPSSPPPPEAWLPIEEPTTTGRPAGWSVDGRTVYLLLDTDGFRCLWGQPFDPKGRLEGTPIPIRHFHGADWAALSTSFGLAFTPQGFLYATMRSRGNIWSLVPASSR
jgi:serine/threonine protein kinase/Tol biopolymer transport system component